jgi:hypothetical protein
MIFISWTKPLGLQLARRLRTFLQSQLPTRKFFVSQDDLVPGQLWRPALEKRLQQDSICILVITPAALAAPWQFYEAGAISAKAGTTVVPLLFDVALAELKEPFGGYESLTFSKESMLRLIKLLTPTRAASKGSKSRDGIVSPGFAKEWGKLERSVIKLLTNNLRTEHGPNGAGHYAFYMLNLRVDAPESSRVHRGYLLLGLDGSDTLKAYFRNCFGEYRGIWHQSANQISVELLFSTDTSDRLFFLLKHSRNWLWGVYCGLASNLSSVAGRCFLDGRPNGSIAKDKTKFISFKQCDAETQDPRGQRAVSEYLEQPIGPTLRCQEPIGALI